jgi:hypothetical protein
VITPPPQRRLVAPALLALLILIIIIKTNSLAEHGPGRRVAAWQWVKGVANSNDRSFAMSVFGPGNSNTLKFQKKKV